jgi:hypothetical protein
VWLNFTKSMSSKLSPDWLVEAEEEIGGGVS